MITSRKVGIHIVFSHGVEVEFVAYVQSKNLTSSDITMEMIEGNGLVTEGEGNAKWDDNDVVFMHVVPIK